jgi:isoleucyl-tRNA synthetase
VDDWFIGVDAVRAQLREENRTVEWTPPQYGKRMDDWLANMGDWNISREALLRPAAAVLPVLGAGS